MRTHVPLTAGLIVAATMITHSAEPKAEKTAPDPKALFECRRASGPITLDGKADEAAWKAAEVIDNFAPFWLRKPDKPARAAFTKTTARVLWDDEAFYFHAEMEDADLFADVEEQDGHCWENDVFELFFKPSESKPDYYEFEVTPKNTHLDMYIPKRSADAFARFGKDRKFAWETKVALKGTLNVRDDKDTSWSVEGRIPWSDLAPTGGRPAAGEIWRFTLCRYDYSKAFPQPELSACAPLTQADYHRHEDYAPLKFVK